MNEITSSAGKVQFFQPSKDLMAVADVIASGVALSRRDLTPERVSEARAMIATADRMLEPASPELIVAWLKRLAPMVRNAPSTQEDAWMFSVHVADICDDIPAAAFNEESRKAWIKQGEKGTWWPAVAELYAHLKPFGDRARRQISGARRIVSAAASKPPETRQAPSPEERAAVAAKMEAFLREKSSQEAGGSGGYEFGSSAQSERLRELAKGATVGASAPSASQRLAEYRQQLRANPDHEEWLAPLIAHLEGEVARINSQSERRARQEAMNGVLGRKTRKRD